MNVAINSRMILNLHSSNSKNRIAQKNFFVRNINQNNKFYMSFEDVGICDDYVWKFHQSKKEQDAYWPFLDLLHTRYIVRGKRKRKVNFRTKKENSEMKFTNDLEKLYQKSLKLKIK